MKELLDDLARHAHLYRDSDTGIAWVEDGSSGVSHSAHPNIDDSGSVSGMKHLGYWGDNDRTVTSNGFIYNIDRCVVDDDYDQLARDHCRCGGHH